MSSLNKAIYLAIREIIHTSILNAPLSHRNMLWIIDCIVCKFNDGHLNILHNSMNEHVIFYYVVIIIISSEKNKHLIIHLTILNFWQLKWKSCVFFKWRFKRRVIISLERQRAMVMLDEFKNVFKQLTSLITPFVWW